MSWNPNGQMQYCSRLHEGPHILPCIGSASGLVLSLFNVSDITASDKRFIAYCSTMPDRTWTWWTAELDLWWQCLCTWLMLVICMSSLEVKLHYLHIYVSPRRQFPLWCWEYGRSDITPVYCWPRRRNFDGYGSRLTKLKRVVECKVKWVSISIITTAARFLRLMTPQWRRVSGSIRQWDMTSCKTGVMSGCVWRWPLLL